MGLQAAPEHRSCRWSKGILHWLQQLPTKQKKSPDMSRTRRQTFPPPGFIRNVTKDWLLERACPTSRAGSTSSYPPRNTQILIRCIHVKQNKKKTKKFAVFKYLIILTVSADTTLTWGAAAAAFFSSHTSGQDVACQRIYMQRLSAHIRKDFNCSVVNNSLYVLN